MDKLDPVLSAAPLLVAGLGMIAACVAFCVRPAEGPAISDALTKLLMICGTAWQATRQPKQPGA